jgi:hypothetical protein
VRLCSCRATIGTKAGEQIVDTDAGRAAQQQVQRQAGEDGDGDESEQSEVATLQRVQPRHRGHGEAEDIDQVHADLVRLGQPAHRRQQRRRQAQAGQQRDDECGGALAGDRLAQHQRDAGHDG